MNNAFLLCFLAGVFFAAAPLVGRVSAVNAMLMTFLITVGSLIATVPVITYQHHTHALATAGSKPLALGVTAGIINGLGLLAYYGLVAGANDGKWEISKVLPIPLIICPILIAVGAAVFFHETLTWTKGVGIILGCVAIFLLSK